MPRDKARKVTRLKEPPRDQSGRSFIRPIDLVTDVVGTLVVSKGGTGRSSWSSGSVVFAGAGGSALAEDNASLFYHDTRNALGVLTTAPMMPLQVAGGLRVGPIGPDILETTITDNPLSAGATTVNVVSTTNYPSTGLFILDIEVLGYTGKTATSFTGVTRGVFNTTAASHALGTVLQLIAMAVAHSEVTVGCVITRDRVGIGNAARTPQSMLDVGTTPSYGGLGTIRVQPGGFGRAISANEGDIEVTNAGGSATGAIMRDGKLVTNNFVLIGFDVGLAPPPVPTTGSGGIVFADRTAFSGMGLNTAGLYADDVGGTVQMFAINEADALTRLTGPFAVLTANRAELQVTHATTELTALTGAAATATNLIPVGSFVLGVTVRVTTTITGATTFDVGDGVDVDRWGAALALSAGTTTSIADFTASGFGQFATANNVVLTANGANFTGGAVRITVHYFNLQAATS